MSRDYLKIVGDVHGKVWDHTVNVCQSDYSLQVGDLGFNYAPMNILDPNLHKFIGGNHDNYDIYHKAPHALGDYGPEELGGLKFFFIRGAFSIDWKGRQIAERRDGNKYWWKEEQLSYGDMLEALDSYTENKPKTMITHTCPTDIARLIGKPDALKSFGYDPNTFETATQSLLQSCFEAHKPNVWIFGHFHMSKAFMYQGTLFICLNIMESLRVDKEGFFNHKNYYMRLGQ